MEDSNFDDCIKDMLSNELKLFPKKGDFSFIKNELIKKSLTYDYGVFNILGVSSINILINKKDMDSDFWKAMKMMCYKKHSINSFCDNLFYLEYIIRYGWIEFTIKYFNSI